MKTWIATFGLFTLLASPHALALDGNAQAGGQKAAVCGACHGVDGNSVNPEWPRLAGQQASYIREQLAAFKAGKRVNPVMSPNAMPLSEQDMADLAAYFSSQQLKGDEADPSLYKAGELLYRGGDASHEIPACMSCHGPEGKGNGPARYPSLRAQHSVYVYSQLKAFASGDRKPLSNDIMQAVAAKMTDEQMRSVASYVQGLR
jgi:cytochrome c553